MARQRFIWPDLWTDPGFGHLAPLEQVIYIGCFSNADDEGRLLGDPIYLKTTVLPYQPISVQRVKNARDRIVQSMPKLELYEHNSVEYLSFRNWNEWQKPKYPRPSKLPAPPSSFTEPSGLDAQFSGNDSPNDSGNASRNASRNDSSVGWEGLGIPPQTPPSRNGPKRTRQQRQLRERLEAYVHNVGHEMRPEGLEEDLRRMGATDQDIADLVPVGAPPNLEPDQPATTDDDIPF